MKVLPVGTRAALALAKAGLAPVAALISDLAHACANGRIQIEHDRQAGAHQQFRAGEAWLAKRYTARDHTPITKAQHQAGVMLHTLGIDTGWHTAHQQDERQK